MFSSLIAAGLALSAGAAMAQSNVTLYGLIDVSLDNVHKEAGKSISGVPLASTTLTRVSPRLSPKHTIRLQGLEDIGGGYKGSFVLEGQFSADTGAQNGQDTCGGVKPMWV